MTASAHAALTSLLIAILAETNERSKARARSSWTADLAQERWCERHEGRHQLICQTLCEREPVARLPTRTMLRMSRRSGCAAEWRQRHRHGDQLPVSTERMIGVPRCSNG